MGWLRKQARKVKKKLNKVFGTKLGNVIGMIGTYFAVGAAMKGLTGLFKGVGSGVGAGVGAGAEAGSVVADAELATTLAEIDKYSTFGKAAEVGGKASSFTLDNMIANATTNSEKAGLFIDGIESFQLGGLNTKPSVFSSLTPAVEETIANSDILLQDMATVKENLSMPRNVQSLAQDFRSSIPSDLNVFNNPDIMNAPISDAVQLQTEPLLADINISANVPGPQEIVKPLPWDERVKISIQDAGEKFSTGKLLGDDFIPDVAQGAATGLILGELQEEPEMPFQSRGVSPMPMAEQAQAAHIQAMSPQIAAAGLNITNFQDLSNNLLYGSGTPNYLANNYQPINMPSIPKIG